MINEKDNWVVVGVDRRKKKNSGAKGSGSLVVRVLLPAAEHLAKRGRS